MNKTLGWKLALIVGTLLFFLFGIFGVPGNWSGQGLLAAMQQRIHLGLDLKGGTHLILQVQVNDAVNVDSDNAIERLKQERVKRHAGSPGLQPASARACRLPVRRCPDSLGHGFSSLLPAGAA